MLGFRNMQEKLENGYFCHFPLLDEIAFVYMRTCLFFIDTYPIYHIFFLTHSLQFGVLLKHAVVKELARLIKLVNATTITRNLIAVNLNVLMILVIIAIMHPATIMEHVMVLLENALAVLIIQALIAAFQVNR